MMPPKPKPTPGGCGFRGFTMKRTGKIRRSCALVCYSRFDPLELPELPEPDLPELDDCPEAGLCGEIWPLPVPVLPALVYWLLPVPGPPCWFFVLSSGRSLFWPGVVEPLCWVDDWLPLPDWVPRFICCDPLPDWL